MSAFLVLFFTALSPHPFTFWKWMLNENTTSTECSSPQSSSHGYSALRGWEGRRHLECKKLKVNCQEKSHWFGNSVSAMKLLECMNSIGILLAACITSVFLCDFESINAKLTWKVSAFRSRCLQSWIHVMAAINSQFNWKPCLMAEPYQTIQRL